MRAGGRTAQLHGMGRNIISIITPLLLSLSHTPLEMNGTCIIL
jgi:hypothetical protein